MNEPVTTPNADANKLSAVFAARRARLAHDLTNEPTRARQRPLGPLRDYGYSVAGGFALVAVLPIVLRVLFRQRTFVFKLLMAALRIRKWRRSVAPRRAPGRR